MSSNALYTDLSGYYDLMCADINYYGQSYHLRRLHQIFGNQGKQYLDLACGTGPHIKHFIDFGYQASGIDINLPMLAIAQAHCPTATFLHQDMRNFTIAAPVDLISCCLYSIHYNATLSKLQECIASVHAALNPGGVFCFNAVDKNTIDNRQGIKHSVQHNGSHFSFQSSWHYSGEGDIQKLQLRIEKTTGSQTEIWQDEHPMVALSFKQLQDLLQPYFNVDIFEHDFDKIVPWNKTSGNAMFVCVKNK